MTIRAASPADDPALREIDVATQSPLVTPAGRPSPDDPFFSTAIRPDDVLVATGEDGEVIGYVQLGQADALPSNEHVVQIRGLAVAPSHQGAGVAHELLDSAIERAREGGARRITLRVLATNEPARNLYSSAGFAVEGVLQEEFQLQGKYVDDVLMALTIRSN